VSAPENLQDSPATAAALTIARLEARVAALEAALLRRSRELQRLQRALPPRDLVIVSRLLADLPLNPAMPYDPAHWRETSELTAAEVEDVLTDLWRSLAAAPGAAGSPQP